MVTFLYLTREILKSFVGGWGAPLPPPYDVTVGFYNVHKSALCLPESGTKEIEAIWTDVICDWGG